MSDRLTNLVRAYADEQITADELVELERRLRESPEARERFLREMNLHAALDDIALAVSSGAATSARASVGQPAPSRVARGRWTARRVWYTAGAVALVLVVTLTVWRHRSELAAENAIAKITGTSGPLQWTGDAGVVQDELATGTQLAAGTVEGTSPRSWLEVEFDDGTKVSLAGRTRVVFPESERREVRLHSGQLFADVRRQPAGRSFVVWTPTATLEVLGTQFRVEADEYSTAMTVSEGRVRVTRSTDGHVVDVDAGQRVVIAADQPLEPRPEPVVANEWRSEIELGPTHTLGRWRPASGDENTRLACVPYTTEEDFVIHAVGLGVSRCDGVTVVLRSGTRLRLQGSLNSAKALFVGLTVRTRNGDFAGRFQTVLPKEHFRDGELFDVVLDVNDFGLDPSLEHVRDRLPREPFDLVVESVWCHTLWNRAGLSVSSAELLPADED